MTGVQTCALPIYEKSLELIEEKKRIVIKLREEVLRKRNSMLEGREKHEIINKKTAENNLYAANISLESVANGKKKANKDINGNNSEKNVSRVNSSSSITRSYKWNIWIWSFITNLINSNFLLSSLFYGWYKYYVIDIANNIKDCNTL